LSVPLWGGLLAAHDEIEMKNRVGTLSPAIATYNVEGWGNGLLYHQQFWGKPSKAKAAEGKMAACIDPARKSSN